MDSPVIFVVAGNQREFDRYRQEHQDQWDSLRYVPTVDRMKGVMVFDVVFTGSWSQRHDLDDILVEIEIMRGRL